MRNIKNKRSLYESIMKNISKTVKRKLNEDDKNFNINDYDEDEIYTVKDAYDFDLDAIEVALFLSYVIHDCQHDYGISDKIIDKYLYDEIEDFIVTTDDKILPEDKNKRKEIINILKERVKEFDDFKFL